MLTFLTRGAERTAFSETTRQATARRSTALLDLARMTPDAALRHLGSAPEGLTAHDVRELTQRFGSNDIRHDRPAPAVVQFVKAFGNPFVLILLFLAGVLFITDVVMADPADGPDYKGVLTVSIMATISAVLRFWQEYRAGNAAEKLRAMVTTTAAVTRCVGGKPVSGELDIQDIVPGDILTLAAGDMLPADVRFLRTKDLQLNQSMLTGEAMPVEKSAEPLPPAVAGADGDASDDVDPLNADNLGFMGTSVVSGSGTAVVVATGNRTAFGSLAASLSGTRPETSFDVGIRKVSTTLIRFMLIMVPTVFIINGLTKDWTSAFLFGVTTAVGLTPEMLPLVVTANLAKGANLMAKHRVIVRRLNSIQNLGAMDVLATDKTGTLTEDRIVLEQHLDSAGRPSERTLLSAAVNAHFQTGLRGLLDRAILDAAGDELPRLTGAYTLVDEMPFDFARRRLSVVVEDLDGHTVVTKGAVEEVLALCTHELVGRVPGGRTTVLGEERRREIEELVAAQNALGLRVLAVAVREIPFAADGPRAEEDLPRTEYTVDDERDMTLLGFLTFLDPPKASAGPALASLARNGVAVKVITGDGALVAQKVCADVGLDTGQVVLGQETESLDLKQLGELAERTTLFAKVNPAQKARILEAMREHGHTVGYLGDGVNDAPALRTADVGISVDTAVDIAKESADIILLDKDLTVLEAGVIEGRRTFVNTMKYIKMTASSNFGNMFSVLVASAMLPFLPMIPVVALIQGLAYDVSMLTLPWDRVDRKELSRPRVWEAESLSRFMTRIGPLSSIFDISTYALMWFVFAANTPEHAALFQSGWFVESIISQTLIVHFLRTRRVPFLRSRASLPVLIATLAVCVFGLVLPFTGFGAGLGLVPLPWTYFPWLVLTLAAYCGVVQLAKRLFIRRFGAWI
ncbi:magnesium-translocating P-type ATPase [Arthrobacter woluwensis]|uniref:magnesium-translocating P-type ATPase n=1 Tax=Arthrobacter woluwensis TaxID=156980 RepID=UPI001AAEC274|nr:magnesium-translocating P-type ATPase [Arthrobacter woluwensis]QTF70625.1 magnesium-translocating P-type ATPase [Arthrobacter woluwensis]